MARWNRFQAYIRAKFQGSATARQRAAPVVNRWQIVHKPPAFFHRWWKASRICEGHKWLNEARPACGVEYAGDRPVGESRPAPGLSGPVRKDAANHPAPYGR